MLHLPAGAGPSAFGSMPGPSHSAIELDNSNRSSFGSSTPSLVPKSQKTRLEASLPVIEQMARADSGTGADAITTIITSSSARASSSASPGPSPKSSGSPSSNTFSAASASSTIPTSACAPPTYDALPSSAYSSGALDLAQRNADKQAIRDARAGMMPDSAAKAPRLRLSTSALDDGRDGEAGSAGGREEPDGKEMYGLDALPDNMNVKDALAQCEDPQLGWSLQFWITIEAPVTGHVFYACPATGQTSWKPPTGVFVVPRQPEGEWWELADTSRGNRSYLYNTLTKVTQWTRPEGEAFVIPLGLIQPEVATATATATASGKTTNPVLKTRSSAAQLRPPAPITDVAGRARSSSTPPEAATPATAALPGPSTPTQAKKTRKRVPPSPLSPLTPRHSRPAPRAVSILDEAMASCPVLTLPSLDSGNSLAASAAGSNAPSTPPTPRAAAKRLARLSVVGEEMSGNEADDSVVSDDTSVPSWAGRGLAVSQKTKPAGALKMFSRKRLSSLVTSRGKENINPLKGLASRNSSTWTISAPSPIAQDFGSELRTILPLPAPPASTPPDPLFAGPIAVPTPPPSMALRTQHLVNGLYPLVPMDITDDITTPSLTSDAAKQFAIRHTGILWRQRVPIERVLQWQKDAIGGPLLEGSKPHAKEAVMCFKIIQRTMGERDRAVTGAKPVASSSSLVDLAAQAAEEAAKRNPQMRVLNEVRWMIQVAVKYEALRDEVFVQIIKQLTKTPEGDGLVLGFQLFCVVVSAFGPSKLFRTFVHEFLVKHLTSEVRGVDAMAKYCLAKLNRTGTAAVRARTMTLGEIEHASNAAFYPSMYGDSLDAIMWRQASSYPDKGVPVILPFLAQAIVRMGGLSAEGIFRVPGDAEAVSELRSRMDRGHYHLAGVSDPHIAASLFKLFLRELEEPVVPTWRYNDALIATATPNIAVDFVRSLPVHHRRVLAFVICFVRLFCADELVAVTKMTPSNLALVLAPNILRTTSESLVTVYTNASYESKLMLMLLEHLNEEEDLDVEDRPDLENIVDSIP